MFDVIGKRNWFFLFSGLIVVPGFIFILLTPLTNGKVGLQFSVDYTGGTVWEVQFKNVNASADEVRAVFVQNGVTDAEVTRGHRPLLHGPDQAVRTCSRSPRCLRQRPPPAPPRRPALPPRRAPRHRRLEPEPDSGTDRDAIRHGERGEHRASASCVCERRPVTERQPFAERHGQPNAFADGIAEREPSASATPAPTPAPVVTGIDQNGKSCPLQLPTEGKLAGIALALQADPRLGPISCTRQETTVGPIVSAS